MPTRTCTATGCFISTSCIKLTCRLKDEVASTDNIQIAFRIVKALNDNQIIIGLNEVRRYDLTKLFRHLFVDRKLEEHVHRKKETTNLCQQPSENQEYSLTDEEGEGGGNYSHSSPSRRAIMPLSPRRSRRLNPQGIYSQPEIGSQPDSGKSHASLLELHLNNLIDGKLISKDELLTNEEDTDYIEDYIDTNLLDDLYFT